MSDPVEGVTNGLASLTATLRAQGSRVGMGELLTAHRALEAVDCASREDAKLALRAVLCSDRGDLARFELAFLAVYGSGAPLGQSPFDELGGIEREALPHAGLATGGAPPPPSPDGELSPVPAAWSDVELLRHKDFATYTDAEMAIARLLIAQLARRGPTRLSRRTRPRGGADTRPICGASSAPRSVPPGSRSTVTGGRRRAVRDRWCSSAMCQAR